MVATGSDNIPVEDTRPIAGLFPSPGDGDRRVRQNPTGQEQNGKFDRRRSLPPPVRSQDQSQTHFIL